MISQRFVDRLQPDVHKTCEHSDGNGLSIIVYPSGVKKWFVRWREGKQRRSQTIGTYPEMTLKEARQWVEDFNAGLKPKRTKFTELVAEWYEAFTLARPHSSKYEQDMRYRLDKYILPAFGKRDVTSIRHVELVRFLNDLARTGQGATARILAGVLGQIFRYAENVGTVEVNPAVSLSRSILATKKTEHFKHLTKPEHIGKLIASLRHVRSEKTRIALLLLAYVFPRESEALKSTPDEFDFKSNLWTVPAEHTKLKREHVIPLPSQVVAFLRPYVESRSGCDLVFPMTRYALAEALKTTAKRAGIPHTTLHGFRHTASTILYGQNFNTMWIESALSHVDSNRIRGIYNSYEFLDERRAMLQSYADYLDQLASKADGNTAKPRAEVVASRRR